jgi:ribosomal subunit interface protein
MQVPIQITVREMQQSDALEAQIRQKVSKLEALHDRITSCRVTVEQLARHHHQGRPFRVTVDVRVPGREIVANRDHHEDVYVALRDAFDAVRRQLEDAARQQRGAVKAHPVPVHGEIVRLFPGDGVGFIRTPDGRELYFSRDNVVHPDFEQLGVGSQVQFVEEMGAEGPQAKRVSVGKHGY